ncbi:hypothetical protein RvY_09982 [Ramazzottius varieornatus]|uniref:Peptidase S1 domain-containing protein n=1 Tax=Ramazzottius varieornatus TaxID=947166 RepID=A0A1D1VJ14_RAMVA|nr:hypothetical protein RvY_09982 [Ramazzottius varieornatus]
MERCFRIFLQVLYLLLSEQWIRTDAIPERNWQASRIILADESGEPIRPSMDDAEAFGEVPGSGEESLEAPFFTAFNPPVNHEKTIELARADNLQDFTVKRSLKTTYGQSNSRSPQSKAKSKYSRWMNDVLAARGVASTRYQVGQKKEYEASHKDNFQCGVQKVAPNDRWNPRGDVMPAVDKRRVEARRHSWPWQVDIFFWRVTNDTAVRVHLCGGTLIDRWHVVTAAHCNIIRTQNFALGRPKSYYVRVGQHFRSAEKDTVQTIRVEKFIDHPLYNDSVSEGDQQIKFFLFNDIAFLRLDRPVELSDEVHPICLDLTGGPSFGPGSTCYATGWSLDEFDYQKWIKGEYSEVLNESKSKIAKDSFCAKHHSGYNPDVTLCTKYYPGHYSCHGDSGGPLQCERDGRFYLVGIVSYDVATSCRTTGMTYFTKIRGVQNWLQTMVEKSFLEVTDGQLR